MGTANLLACNYGTSNLEVAGYRLVQAAEVRDQFGRIGTRVQVEVDAYLYGSSTPDIEAKLAAVIADLSIDGRDFTITGANSAPELTLAAAACQWGGPFPSFEYTDGETAFSKKFKLRISAAQILNGGAPHDNYTLTTEKRHDGLLTVTRGGQINGANVPAYFTGNVIVSFRQQYAAPNWIVEASYEASQDAAQSRVNYRLTARQLASPLPVAPDGTAAVAGTQVTQTTRDEQQRLITSIRYDLTLALGGDPMALMAMIRPRETILHEQWSITAIEELKLTAEFTILQTADPDSKALVNFQQRLEYQPASQIWEERTYIGADPIIVQGPSVLPRLTQSGEATALGMFFAAPEPFLANGSIDAPQITFEDSNFQEKLTRWQFSYYGLDDNGDPLSPNWVPPVLGLGREAQRDDYVGDVGNG